MELKFNPGEGVAHLSSADKGISIMVCQSHTSAKTEQIQECEEALLATENTRQLDQLLRLSKGVTCAPEDNFWELKINNTMFMSLVWVLFGFECNYYKGLRNVYATFKSKEFIHGLFLTMGAHISMMSKPPWTSRDRRTWCFHSRTSLSSWATSGMPFWWNKQIFLKSGSGRTRQQ